MTPKKTETENYRQVSVSEFFEKNRHMLGFDSLQKSLFMIVKEAVDNSLDACEESGTTPEISVEISILKEDLFEVKVLDNGPGIERSIVPKVFGQLLYGSRFHVLKQSRGQQGIGITAAILYGQSTSGEPSIITTRRKVDSVAYRFVLGIDIKNNVAKVHSEDPIIWPHESGTEICIKARGRYVTGRQSIFEYLKELAVVNPNAKISFTDPEGKKYIFEKTIDEPSKPPKATKPHPYGVEIGDIIGICADSSEDSMENLLISAFSRISRATSLEILEKSGIDPGASPHSIDKVKAESIIKGINDTKLMPPSAESLSPISEKFIRTGMLSVYGEHKPSFYGRPVTGKVAIYKGNPFSVETGMVFGGALPADQPILVLRYANKVPLLFHPGSCAITKAISETDWRQFGFEQKQGKGVPYGPAIIMVHVFGPRLPYTSESKEAIAPVDEITDAIKYAIKMELKQLRRFNSRAEKNKKMGEKFNLVSTVIPEIARKSSEILSMEIPDCRVVISKIANVVFVRETFVERDGNKHSVTEVINYTMNPISMNLKIVFRNGEVDKKIEDLGMSEKFVYEHTEPLNVSDEAEYYFTGINPVLVQGADELPSDWGLKGVEAYESEE